MLSTSFVILVSTFMTLAEGQVALPTCENLFDSGLSPKLWFSILTIPQVSYTENWNLKVSFSGPISSFNIIGGPSSSNQNARGETVFNHLPNLSVSRQPNSQNSFIVRRTANSDSLGLRASQKWSFNFFVKIKYGVDKINVKSIKYNDVEVCQQKLSETVKKLQELPCGATEAHKSTFLIYNGEDTNPNDWPWLTALYVSIRGGLNFQCGAVLISEKHVLTAAHCKVKGLEPKHYIVFFGKYKLSEWGDVASQSRVIENFIQHPVWASSKKPIDHDIALIILKQRVTFSDFVYPVCLWTPSVQQNMVNGNIGWVAGWGKTEEDTLSDTPKLVKMPLVTDEECKKSNTEFLSKVTNFNFCAGSKNGSGPCVGDSGGGMYISQPSPLGGSRWMLRGIVSISLLSGRSCDLSNYVIFTDMNKFYDWVIQVIENNS